MKKTVRLKLLLTLFSMDFLKFGASPEGGHFYQQQIILNNSSSDDS